MKYKVEQFSFENDSEEYLDVQVHLEGYIELKIETTDSFVISNQDELDLIYQKLTEALKSINK